MARSKKNLWKPAAWLLSGLALAAIVFSAVMRYSSEQLLERDAELTAQSWAKFVSVTVPDLEPLLTRGELTEDAREQLKRFSRVQEVFRFKMFDRDGNTVLVSDDLDKPAEERKTQSNIGHGNENVRSMVLGGKNVILLMTNERNPERPAFYSEAYVPITRNDQVIGVVEVYVDQAERASRIQAGFGLVAGAVFALLSAIGLGIGGLFLARIKAQRLAEERMRYLAHHDVLSGLLNRASFNEALHEAVWRHEAGGPGFSVLCLDLDYFKEINDTLGHAAGDEVLRQVGERLRALIRHGDRVARLGGDEFAILQGGISVAEDVTKLAERVVESLAQPYDVGAERVHSSCSVGAAIFGVDARSEEELLHKADLALYRAKAAGRNTFSFYDAELDEKLEARRQLIHDLREALGTEQLSLHYQPQFGGDGKTLTGYEALLRWQHPTRGAQSPADFIALAEDCGLIDPLGRWVLRTACAQAAKWPEHLSVAVNLSAAQFRQGDLVEVVSGALEASGLPASRLELEITESLLMGNTEQATEMLSRLSAMGVRIAMDDFGTGYSSMAYLWRFPFDKLKIDRAFTQHLHSDDKVKLIVKSIISLAHSMDIRVNAEGVENESQRDVLLEHGCDELQGYLLGHPTPDDRLSHLCEVLVAAVDAKAPPATLVEGADAS